MFVETWELTTDYGTDTATLTAYDKADYFVDMGCMLWNRAYKRYSSAKKYLEKCGYQYISTNENLSR